MAKPGGDQSWGYWSRWTICGIFAFLKLLWGLLSPATDLQRGQTTSPRGRRVPVYPWVGNNETWKDLGDALAMPSASGDLRISPNIDPEGQHNVRLVDQLPVIQEPRENIDADNAAAAEADLNMWLAVAEVASLPRQIERDETSMMVRRPQVLSSVAESVVVPSSLVDDLAAGADAPAPEVVGVLAGVLSQRIEDEDEAQVEVEVEVAVEAVPPGMLERISNDARHLQIATASMALPAGDLESKLEERMPVDHPEAGDSSAGLQAKINIQDDAENLEVREPHATGVQ